MCIPLSNILGDVSHHPPPAELTPMLLMLKLQRMPLLIGSTVSIQANGNTSWMLQVQSLEGGTVANILSDRHRPTGD